MLLKKRLFKIDYAITDYDQASDIIIEQGKQHNSFGVSALAVHGLIESVWDKALADQVNKLDLVVADGQPVKWALNSLYNTKMQDRVAGPVLTLHVLKKAHQQNLKLYLYGSTADTLEKFCQFIDREYSDIQVCGIHPDRFREATPEEDIEDIEKINASGANLVFVGRGCPRQEKWVSDHLGKINASMLAIGAAFDFHAGTEKRAPIWMSKSGLEWLFRLAQNPKRLWKRYLYTNSYFILLFLKYKLFTIKS